MNKDKFYKQIQMDAELAKRKYIEAINALKMIKELEKKTGFKTKNGLNFTVILRKAINDKSINKFFRVLISVRN